MTLQDQLALCLITFTSLAMAGACFWRVEL